MNNNNNRRFGGNNNNYNNYNPGNSNHMNDRRPRKKISFFRDGMVLTFSLRKAENPDQNISKDSNVFVELREYTENMNAEYVKDHRFFVINTNNFLRLLLLKPSCVVDNKNLQKIEFSTKLRKFEFEQTKENKYVVSLEVNPKDDQTFEKINSKIELLPEDILLIQKFMENSVQQIFNL